MSSDENLHSLLASLPLMILEEVKEENDECLSSVRLALLPFSIVGGRGKAANVKDACHLSRRAIIDRLCELHVFSKEIVTLAEEFGKDSIALFHEDIQTIFAHMKEVITHNKQISTLVRISKKFDENVYTKERDIVTSEMQACSDFWATQRDRLPHHMKQFLDPVKIEQTTCSFGVKQEVKEESAERLELQRATGTPGTAAGSESSFLSCAVSMSLPPALEEAAMREVDEEIEAKADVKRGSVDVVEEVGAKRARSSLDAKAAEDEERREEEEETGGRASVEILEPECSGAVEKEQEEKESCDRECVKILEPESSVFEAVVEKTQDESEKHDDETATNEIDSEDVIVAESEPTAPTTPGEPWDTYGSPNYYNQDERETPSLRLMINESEERASYIASPAHCIQPASPEKPEKYEPKFSEKAASPQPGPSREPLLPPPPKRFGVINKKRKSVEEKTEEKKKRVEEDDKQSFDRKCAETLCDAIRRPIRYTMGGKKVNDMIQITGVSRFFIHGKQHKGMNMYWSLLARLRYLNFIPSWMKQEDLADPCYREYPSLRALFDSMQNPINKYDSMEARDCAALTRLLANTAREFWKMRRLPVSVRIVEVEERLHEPAAIQDRLSCLARWLLPRIAKAASTDLIHGTTKSNDHVIDMSIYFDHFSLLWFRLLPHEALGSSDEDGSCPYLCLLSQLCARDILPPIDQCCEIPYSTDPRYYIDTAAGYLCATMNDYFNCRSD